jgi:TRAP-type mannitol/chloroaromatic compound transport system substrate-binding protein
MSILAPRHRTAASNPDPSSPGLQVIPSTTTISRRGMILRGGAIAGTVAAFPAPAISQGIRELKMATSWPKGLPGLDSSAKRIGQAITAQTGKRIQVSVFAAGELVKPFEVFDAVSSGVVDMYHSAEYYWERRSPAFNFFAAVPFGFTADELAAWIHFGGGQELWDELTPTTTSNRCCR